MNMIPSVGLGFWQIKKEDAGRVLKDGLEAGYRHIDTAIGYWNEKEIGDALKGSNVDRESIWITSKVLAEVKTYEGTKKLIDESLERLQCGYIDLMLIHAPKPWSVMNIPFWPRYKKANLAVWKALQEARDAGKIKYIGVSNFNEKDIENIIKNSGEVPFANQIHVHIGHTQDKLRKFCKENGIVVEAYSPNGKGSLMKNKKISAIAKKYGVSNAQLCIQYALQLGTIPLPRSKSKNHMEENLKIGFTIAESDMIELSKIKTL